MNTAGKITEKVKGDVALLPISLATTNDTGPYFPMKGYKRAAFWFSAAAMADTETVIAQIFEAKTAVGGSAAALTSAAATITSPVGAAEALLTASTIVDEDSVVTVTATRKDGTTSVQIYSCEDTTPDQSAGEFASGANDTAACVNLAATINALQGDDVLATASTTTVILSAAQPGNVKITISAAHATIVPSILEAVGYVEVDAAQMTALFTHLALKVTTSATIVVAGHLERMGEAGGNEQPGQLVAAAKVL